MENWGNLAEKLMADVAHAVRRRREKLGLSIDALAKRTGLHAKTIEKIESFQSQESSKNKGSARYQLEALRRLLWGLDLDLRVRPTNKKGEPNKPVTALRDCLVARPKIRRLLAKKKAKKLAKRPPTTQRRLADELDIPQATISKILTASGDDDVVSALLRRDMATLLKLLLYSGLRLQVIRHEVDRARPTAPGAAAVSRAPSRADGHPNVGSPRTPVPTPLRKEGSPALKLATSTDAVHWSVKLGRTKTLSFVLANDGGLSTGLYVELGDQAVRGALIDSATLRVNRQEIVFTKRGSTLRAEAEGWTIAAAKISEDDEPTTLTSTAPFAVVVQGAFVGKALLTVRVGPLKEQGTKGSALIGKPFEVRP